MASRTKDKLIDVARQLFAHKGVENTTMNDIASASDKGRRTIYTYFKSKTEIFNAVVNREAQSIIERIADIPSMPISPEEKLMNFIFSRFEAVKEVVGRNGSLKASFFLDVRRVDRIRRVNKHKEIVLLKEILNEGVQQGAFRIKHVDKTAEILLMGWICTTFATVSPIWASINSNSVNISKTSCSTAFSATTARKTNYNFFD